MTRLPTRWGALLALLSLAMPRDAAAQEKPAEEETRESRWSRPLWRVGPNVLRAHVGFVTTPLHLAAVGSTVLLARTSADSDVQAWAAGRDETASIAWSAPGLAGGALVPLLLPAGLWALSDEDERIDAGAAALQSVLVAFTLNTLWKGITNREPPESGVASEPEDTRRFGFGLFRQFPFDGWPSGHMMTNTAMGASLATYYRHEPVVALPAYAWCAYVAASTTLGIRGGVHWASDVLAGGLMGWAIGHTVGKEFALRRAPAVTPVHDHGPPTVSVLPIAAGDRFQLVAIGMW